MTACVRWKVSRLTNESNVVLHIITGKAGIIWQASKGRDAREDRIGLLQSLVRVSTDAREAYLSSSITWQRIIPQRLVRSSNRSLISVVAMCNGANGQRSNKNRRQHDERQQERAQRYWSLETVRQKVILYLFESMGICSLLQQHGGCHTSIGRHLGYQAQDG